MNTFYNLDAASEWRLPQVLSIRAYHSINGRSRHSGMGYIHGEEPATAQEAFSRTCPYSSSELPNDYLDFN
jgi:hypothetical protein